jgi:hypothetical protein
MYYLFLYFAHSIYILPYLQGPPLSISPLTQSCVLSPFLYHSSHKVASLAPFCHKCSPIHARGIHFILRYSHLFAFPSPKSFSTLYYITGHFPRGLPCTWRMEAACSFETLVHSVISQNRIIFVSELVLYPKRWGDIICNKRSRLNPEDYSGLIRTWLLFCSLVVRVESERTLL